MTSQIRQNYKHTINACYIGYITQAVVNNFAPLLFLTFQRSYGISLGKISFLVTVNFGVQLLVDFLAAHFVDRIGYRISIVTAHILAARRSDRTGTVSADDGGQLFGADGVYYSVCCRRRSA